MSRVRTIHRKDERGEQQTYRVIELKDATGKTTRYQFREIPNGYDPSKAAHEFVGEGEPSERALEALEAYLSDD